MFVIVKKSRYDLKPYPYSGPTCDLAKVQPQVYGNKFIAEADAVILSEYNPIGFEVVEIDENGYRIEQFQCSPTPKKVVGRGDSSVS